MLSSASVFNCLSLAPAFFSEGKIWMGLYMAILAMALHFHQQSWLCVTYLRFRLAVLGNQHGII